MILHPKRDDAELLQSSVTNSIVLGMELLVTLSIQFDTEPCLEAIEIEHIAHKRVLPTEKKTGSAVS